MVDAYKFMEYLNRTELAEREFWFLYRVMILQDNNRNGVFKVPNITENQASFNFSLWNKVYQERFSIYLGEKVNWKGLVDKLDSEGYLENWSKDYKMNEMKVTDKFKSNFLISDVEKAFMEFYSIYPKMIRVNQAIYPSLNFSIEVLSKKYNEQILKGGNELLHLRCLMITEIYLDQGNFKDAPMSIGKYFDQYDGIAAMMEEKDKSSDSFYDAI